MTWGVRADFYRRVKAEKGRDPPQEFLNPPRIPPHLIFYSDAFWRLHHDRPVGMAVGRIPWTAMKDYAAHYRVEGDDFDRFITLLVAQDSEYLAVTQRRDGNEGAWTVDTDDAEGVSGLFARIQQRMEQEGEEPSDEEPLEDGGDG